MYKMAIKWNKDKSRLLFHTREQILNSRAFEQCFRFYKYEFV